MARLPLIVAVAALLSGCEPESAKAGPSTPQITPLAPKLPKDVVYHDYGIIPLGTGRSHDLDIPVPRNDYGDTIVHDSFHSSCSCAIGMVMIVSKTNQTRPVWGLPDDQRIVGKDERVILRLTLDTKNLEPVDVARTRVKGTLSFQLTSHEGQHARYEHRYVDFDYGVRTPIKVSPVAHVKFGFLPICNTHHQTLELSSNIAGEKLTLGEVTVTDDCVTAKLVDRGDKQLLEVEITPQNRALRKVTAGIAMPTGRADYPFLRIGVSGTFVGAIQYMPAEVIGFNLFDFKTEKEGFVNLLDHDKSRPKEFVVKDLKDANGNDISKHFEVTFQPLSGRQIRVKVKYLGTLGGMRMAGELRLAKAEGGPSVARLRLTGYNTPK